MNKIRLNTIGEVVAKQSASGGEGLQLKQVTITENGTQSVIPDAEYSGMSKVVVNTDVNTQQGLDFSEIYDQEQADEINQYYKDGIAYGEYIKHNWNNDILKSLEENLQLVYMPEVEYPINYIKNYFFYGCGNLEYVGGEYITLPRPIGAFSYCGALRRIPIFDARLYENLACTSVFSYCTALQDVTIINSSLVASFSSTFMQCRIMRNISIDDVSSCVDFSNMFGSCFALVNLRIGNWKQNNIALPNSDLLSPESIHYIIQNAVNLADGATARTLTLHADAKTNWMNSEYYEEDEITRIAKGIEIA